VIRTSLNDDHYAAFILALNCITLCSEQVHMVGIVKITYGRSWILRRMSWMRNGAEVGIYSFETSGRIYMP